MILNFFSNFLLQCQLILLPFFSFNLIIYSFRTEVPIKYLKQTISDILRVRRLLFEVKHFPVFYQHILFYLLT